ncbi:hypothetical protein [Rhizobacter sp. Root404]|uniref:hypothetical protein n=1 Tax=Rhizobacter sp. Root404 TaxID=1736528 RepID=UPI0012F80638|nr:hypothetical protein [Rhizobacter sp. Root404]
MLRLNPDGADAASDGLGFDSVPAAQLDVGEVVRIRPRVKEVARDQKTHRMLDGGCLHLRVIGVCRRVALGIDHALNFDQGGVQTSVLIELAGAIWEGSETRLGSTFWKAADSMLLADLSAEIRTRVFRRARPE